jgi:hypothetical protein
MEVAEFEANGTILRNAWGEEPQVKTLVETHPEASANEVLLVLKIGCGLSLAIALAVRRPGLVLFQEILRNTTPFVCIVAEADSA